jgi:diadenosine tetraphosphate (Ap4A) HIT family hydrolase
MRRIKLADGSEVETHCLSCAIVNHEIEPTGGVIIETKFFHAHQDIAYPIPGLVIVAVKRHVYGLDELTEEEAAELMILSRKIRKAQREILQIKHVYYFYNEDTTHHFHIWMVPRYEWMYEFGRSIESVRPVLLHAREKMNSEENIEQVKIAIQKLQQFFKS